jgi:hypothetical protein
MEAPSRESTITFLTATGSIWKDPRNDSIKGRFVDDRLSSADAGYEMLVIDTELQMAKSCVRRLSMATMT